MDYGNALGAFSKKIEKLGSIALVAGIYFCLAWASLRLATLNASASPFWPASGLAFAAILARRSEAAWGIFLGAFLANLTTSIPWTASLGIAAGNLCESLVARSVYNRIMLRTDDSAILQSTFAVSLAAITGSLLSASLAYVVMEIHPSLRDLNNWTSFLTWWGGDITGMMVLTPVLLRGFKLPAGSWLQSVTILLIASTVVVTLSISFQEGMGGFVFLIFLPMLLSALCLRGSWVVRFAAVTAVGAIICAASGNGPFFGLQLNENLLGFQLLINSLMLAALCAENFLVHARRIQILPLLGLGCLLSGLLFHAFHQRHAEQDGRHLEDLVLKAKERILSHMDSYTNALYDFAGLIATTPDISSKHWQDFVEASQVLERIPELYGIGFVAALGVAEKETFVTKRQAIDGSAPSLRSDCESQKSPKDEYAIVQFISPMKTNARALGLDVSCEMNRFRTLQKARQSHQPSLTPPIVLAQEHHKRPGFLLYVPVYSQQRFLGWISGVFIVPEMLQKLLLPFENELYFSLAPNLNASPVQILYQTDGLNVKSEWRHNLRLYDQNFQLSIGRAQGFQSSKDLAFAWIGSFGILLTLALGHLVTSSLLIHQRAKEEVNRQIETIASRDRLWQTMTDFAPVGIFRVNAQGEPTFSNRFWENLTGGSHVNSTAEERWKRVHPEDRQRLMPLWRNLLTSGSILREEMRLVKPQGLTWVKVHAAPIIGSQGQFEGFVGVALDITERKLREAEIEKERIKVIHTAKMASLGEMASGIAHEINNPLAVINAIACHLQMRNKDLPNDVVPDVKRLEEMTERIAKIIRGLRAFSRNSDKDPIRPVDLHAIITDTLALCQARFEASEVHLKAQEIPHLQVGCRGGQLSQVLLNLLSNAHDAALSSRERWVRLETECHGGRVLIRVTDSGPGIPPSILNRIMEPFFTTKDVDKGTGLGLSIAKGIAEDHGGRLWLDSSAKHTCFVLELGILEAASA